MPNLPKARLENIVIQDLEKETLIYDLNTNKALCLNETSALVWQLCDGNNSIAEISHLLSKKLKIYVTEEFVWLALDSLKKDELLEKSDEIEINFNGLTRRQVIKKVGLASMIALPLISSVVAPQAVQAQSGFILLDGFCSPTGPPCQINRTCITVAGFGGVPQKRCCRNGGATQAPGAIFDCRSVLECVGFSVSSECCSGESVPTQSSCGPGLVRCRCLPEEEF